MSVIQNAINEVNRLQALTEENRAKEGVNATTAQFKGLLKSLENIERNKNKKHNLSGMGRYVSDYASQESKLLKLIDKVANVHGT